MLSIKNLTVSYDNKIAVNDISLELKPATITGLIGPNGAGKSTLMKTCIGIISNYAGDIYFGDLPLAKNRYRIKQQAVYAAENAELLNYLTGQEFLTLISKIYRMNNAAGQIDFFIDLMGLEKKRHELIDSYSHGMRQKISVAAALLPSPQYILLDESLNGMDSVSLSRIFNYLTEQRDKNRIILISSHNVELIEQWCEEVFVISDGTIKERFSINDIKNLRNEKGAFLKKYMELIK
jgi:ABC-2 type transport system ATP-binding protein